MKFLHLVDKHFPRSTKLHKLFNRNTIKVSYSCTDNMAKIIKNHNKKVTSKDTPMSPKCNCREKETCPLNGNCQATSVIYEAKVKTATNPEKKYICIYRTYRSDTEAKKLHTQIIIQQPKIHQQHCTIKHIWKLKDNNQAHAHRR